MTWQEWSTNPGHLGICQSPSDIPVVGKSPDEKLLLEQAGSLRASLPLLLCFNVLGVNVSESKQSVLIKGGTRLRKKHALLHIPKEGYLSSISIALPSVAKSGREPKPCWNVILFLNLCPVWHLFELRKFGLLSFSTHSNFQSGRFGVNLCFPCLQGSRSFYGWVGMCCFNTLNVKKKL